MLNLPPVVVEYLSAERERDAARLSLCFAEDGVVHDEARDRHGRDGIRRWKEEVDAKYHYVSELLAASAQDNTVTLRVRLTGDFPGSPIEVNQIFRLERGQIASLEIRS